MSEYALPDSLAPTPSRPVLELFSLHGRTALVTGGSRGIGKSIAIALAQAGARVILVQRDVTMSATKDAINALPGSAGAAVVQGDLANLDDCSLIFQRALDSAPEGIDILVNCGGMLMREDSVNVTRADWNTVLDVNLNSLFILSQHAGEHFISRKRGKIINVASLNSFIGGFRVASYSAAKGAVLQLTKALSNEWARYNINVNAIAPGSIATDINTEARKNPEFIQSRLLGTPGGRWGAPEDFAGVAVFLASQASSFITGEVITVDGGAMAKGPI
ncbi:hypothetical protein DB88DRAFT_494712 [Papiliotrema laurentii]|uniref:2-deoxy-D-gluconate 3-dehydrogenase n=1 Tax=Papiliotrema laurentii TaxID=5418 RepID=A0AAD9FQC7_PAPLA|nr:hypothetical protein DB88DRAFT_494712 [Papiliotrema laurentii]